MNEYKMNEYKNGEMIEVRDFISMPWENAKFIGMSDKLAAAQKLGSHTIHAIEAIAAIREEKKDNQ